MTIFLYGHNGSGNHGCEAIVRSTVKIINSIDKDINLISDNTIEDKKYGLSEVVNLISEKNKIDKFTAKYINAYINLKILKRPLKSEELVYTKTFNSINSKDIVLSIGGDNYCYDGYERFIMLHNMVLKRKAKSVLWGCSVEPKKISQNMKKDLLNYDLIVARESITYNALKEIGANVKLYPDPAFQLDIINEELPSKFLDKNTVGINISPMIINNELKNGITIENYANLIEYIIKNTDMNIALIPHVIWKDNNDDREPLKGLYERFKDTNRVIMLEDTNCEILKGYISRCRFFIGARTHATIAAYSTLVPTLVLGYSVKAKGIAKDIFGTYDNYVIPVQDLKTDKDLIHAFKWMYKKEYEIKIHLQKFMPNYKKKALLANLEIKNLVCKK